MDPSTVPTSSATSPVPKPRPLPAPRVPENTAVMVRLGAKNTVSNRTGRPNRLAAGIGVIPCDSITRSPARVGIRPPKTSAVSAVLSIGITLSYGKPPGRRRVMDLAPSTSHWGAFSAGFEAGGQLRVTAHPDDQAPSPLLGNLPSSLRHPTRVAAPAI